VKKKVLLITGIYFPDIGGPATYVPNLARRFTQLNMDVRVISLTDEVNVLRPFEPWQTIFVPRNINKLKRTMEVVKTIRKNMHECDYIFSNGLFIETALASFFSKRSLTAKIVGDPVWERTINKNKVNLTIEEFNSKPIFGSNRFLRILYNFALRKFTKITTPSYGLAELVSGWGIDNVKVIHNGTECLSNENTRIDFDVVSVSRLVSWKRVDVLIRACQIANLSLLVVGDGPEMENLKKLSKELDASVLFLGQVGKEASIASIRRAKIFALLSTYEGLSFSLIEAMMLKKRILVSNAAGNLEVIRDGIDGIVLNDMNPRSVAKKLIQLCDDSSTSIFQENCYAQAIDRYCLETQLDKMIELILRD